MSNVEKQMAIALGGCTFPPGLPAKRFAREMSANARSENPKPLTDKQATWLRKLVQHYRRQIPPAIVALATQPQPESSV